jgi:hypothetical protein
MPHAIQRPVPEVGACTRFFRHGIIAARIKPQHAKGMHSGFWLFPQGTKYTYGAPAGGSQIDVMEFWRKNGRGSETIGAHGRYYNEESHQGQPRGPVPAGPQSAGTLARLVGRVPRLLRRVDADRVHLPDRRARLRPGGLGPGLRRRVLRGRSRHPRPGGRLRR